MLGKARRSFGISIGILLLGFMAIGFALVYRVMRDAPPPAVAAMVSIPAGAEVVSAIVAEKAINVTYRLGRRGDAGAVRPGDRGVDAVGGDWGGVGGFSSLSEIALSLFSAYGSRGAAPSPQGGRAGVGVQEYDNHHAR